MVKLLEKQNVIKTSSITKFNFNLICYLPFLLCHALFEISVSWKFEKNIYACASDGMFYY